jgi:hypothetical protein
LDKPTYVLAVGQFKSIFCNRFAINMKTLRTFSVLCFSLLPIPVLAQCNNQLCQNLQNVLYAAITDFREYRALGTAVPSLSINGAKVPCQMSTWANNVPMFICSAQVPYPSAESWYTSMIADLRILQPSWQLKIDSPVADHFVDAGPSDCELPATEGPYLGHCPLHLQLTKQNDGTAKVYLWMSSLSSPYLVNRPPAPPSKSVPPIVAGLGCDDLCQGLKKAFEARNTAFAEIRADKSSGGMSDATIKLSGAAQCAVGAASKPHPTDVGTQFVCYWPETSISVAETRFRDLISRFQVLVPSSWSIRQEDESEELTGAKATEWCAVAPDNKQEACVYISREYLGLHIEAWN